MDISTFLTETVKSPCLIKHYAMRAYEGEEV
jgi:hypothetical protein